MIHQGTPQKQLSCTGEGHQLGGDVGPRAPKHCRRKEKPRLIAQIHAYMGNSLPLPPLPTSLLAGIPGIAHPAVPFEFPDSSQV